MLILSDPWPLYNLSDSSVLYEKVEQNVILNMLIVYNILIRGTATHLIYLCVCV